MPRLRPPSLGEAPRRGSVNPADQLDAWADDAEAKHRCTTCNAGRLTEEELAVAAAKEAAVRELDRRGFKSWRSGPTLARHVAAMYRALEEIAKRCQGPEMEHQCGDAEIAMRMCDTATEALQDFAQSFGDTETPPG